MELDKISFELEQSLEDARQLAEAHGERLITSTHLLYVMLAEGGPLRCLAEQQGWQCEVVLDYLALRLLRESRNPPMEAAARAIASRSLRNRIESAFEVADQRKSELVEAVDFLAAVLTSGEESLRSKLREAGVTLGAISST